MKLDILSPRRREAYEFVEKYLKEHPGSSVKDASKAGGFHVSNYYTAKQMLKDGKISGQKKKRRKRVVMHTLPVEPMPAPQSNIVAFVGSPESVVNSIKEFLRS